MATQGVLLPEDALRAHLATIGCDRENEAFCVRGGFHAFLGVGPDILIDGTAECRIGDRWQPLVPLLEQRCGLRTVTVI